MLDDSDDETGVAPRQEQQLVEKRKKLNKRQRIKAFQERARLANQEVPGAVFQKGVPSMT